MDPIKNKSRILVVDDEEDVRGVLAYGLISAGYDCLSAASGRDALAILEKNLVDVVVSDINMPHMTGLELVQRVKATYDIDFIIMTGYVEDFSYEDIIGLGATDFIQKPVGLREFIARLRRVLLERKTREERNQAILALKANLAKSQRAMEGIIQAIAATVEIRDPYTSGHQERVAALSCAIAQLMNLPSDTVYGLRMAATLHDLGKIAVPAEILSRPGPLNELEYGLIKNHVQYGYDILKKIEFPWPLAKIVYQHHERMNGSGYPLGLKAEEIILEARILAVADVVETISSHRPYRPSLGMAQALEELIEHRGTLYDANAVDVCIQLASEKQFQIKNLL
jgi:putative two-component system response regulator